MSPWVIFALFLTSGLAICASAIAISAAQRAFATAANASSRISELEKAERLTPSKLAELSAFNEAISRAEELLVKVNRREIARAKARADDGTYVRGNGATTKDELRIRAGLRAGQPPAHQ